jgi:mannose-6-phosphate isomerase-like protein (cupin superfamily)
MKRRLFLKTAAAAFPAAGFSSFALSRAHATPPPTQARLVLNGEDCLGESHSLGFSSIRFKVLPSETNSGVFLIEHDNLVKGGPPLHLHLYQEEWFYVVEGQVMFQIGDERKMLRSGDSILGPRNVPHAFSSVGEKPGRMLIAFTPAGKMEAFFRAAAIPSRPAQDAEMFRRFDMKLIGPSPLA